MFAKWKYGRFRAFEHLVFMLLMFSFATLLVLFSPCFLCCCLCFVSLFEVGMGVGEKLGKGVCSVSFRFVSRFWFPCFWQSEK